MKAFTVNIGVNTTQSPIRRSGPIYANGSFDYVPIPSSDGTTDYEELGLESAFGRMGIENKLQTEAHHDPEFLGFTYGTYPEDWGNVANLKKIESGDMMVFFGSLERTTHERIGNKFPSWIADPRGMYLIGMFEVTGVLTRDGQLLRPRLGREAYRANEHYPRLGSHSKDTSWIFKGSAKSCLFPVAVPVTREDFQMLFEQKLPQRTAQGETALVSSYMRAAREVRNLPYLVSLISKFCPSVLRIEW